MERADKFRRDGTLYPPGDVGLFEWAKDIGNREYSRVALNKFANGIEVSTVWLGLDHSHGSTHRPLIFESIVFIPARKEFWSGGKKLVLEHDEAEMWRYSTEEEARLGHKMLCKKWGMYKSIGEILDDK